MTRSSKSDQQPSVEVWPGPTRPKQQPPLTILCWFGVDLATYFFGGVSFGTSNFMVTMTLHFDIVFTWFKPKWSWDEFNGQSQILQGLGPGNFMVRGVTIPHTLVNVPRNSIMPVAINLQTHLYIIFAILPKMFLSMFQLHLATNIHLNLLLGWTIPVLIYFGGFY